ncbi:hypothetical protein JM79_2464 [Gramella sp. Hel_I_59]|uniref:glycosyltransferase family 10 domain-containing protein n=1 Tax=Gramella sp. Hel_I_59 TaxID=1249978 RepID=UPI0011523C7C|nr:glycosyltransferase family 10 [Gramella sp. Hel_I_59]TQI71524.1 hypothetical protein JM79_2464 [Gramella sp. Hel_I_59]
MENFIKLYKIKSFVFTPFENERDLEYLRSNGIVLTGNIMDADILISQNYKHLKKYFIFSLINKKFLVWTLEPRFNTSFKSVEKVLGGFIKCHFMNIYTRDVFTTGLNFHAKNISKKLAQISDDFELKNRRVVALMSYFKGIDSSPLLNNGDDIDLIKIRTKIALKGFEKDLFDIYGRGWPEGIVVENSRRGNWKDRKIEILKSYNFNLCFENTMAHNYITEKIWDSIENYCLPIYYGKGNNIYQIFPKESFIDYSNFTEPSDLFNYIENMSSSEFIERINKCISVYNKISNKGESFIWEQRKLALDKIIEKVTLIK